MLYQQGDVLIDSVDALPIHASPVPRRDGRTVLVRGEATGHTHATADDVEVFALRSALFCRASAPFTVLHDEHKPVTVPPGTYRVRRVREYDHFSDEALEVMD
jgi:hypothetical protein